MASITITVTDGEKIQKVLDSILGLHPIPLDLDGQPVRSPQEQVREVLIYQLKVIDKTWREKQQTTIEIDEDLAS